MATRSGVNKRRISQVMTSLSDIPSMSFMEDLFGQEFPEAFGSGGTKSAKSILDLPAELLAIIRDQLSGLEIKRLRLANKRLAERVHLRLDRVYVSPNRANLQCLRKIMDHARYRLNVVEVVWDDAQLDEYPDLQSFRHAVVADEHQQQRELESLLKSLAQADQHDCQEYGAFEHDDLFLFDEAGKLTELAKEMLLRHDEQLAKDMIARNATTMSMEESYELYQELYEEEQEAMERGYDAAALRHVLANCPTLKRVVLTSEVWRPWHPQPVYQTPFYRSLPLGFRKPSVWPWLSHRPHSTPEQASHRDNTMTRKLPNDKTSLPSEFRGYSIAVSSLLATPHSSVTEFIIYAAHEPIGITHQLFATPNADFILSMALAHTVPLKRLQLALNSHGSDATYLVRSTQLHDFLAALSYLEHLDLAPNCYFGHDADTTLSLFRPKLMIPHALLPRLKTFALRNAAVASDQLLPLITAQTAAVHITLDNVHPVHPEMSYEHLFWRVGMHHESRVDVSRPMYEVSMCEGEGRCRVVCEELCEWVYRGDWDMESVFVNGKIREGVGWVHGDRDLV
ncbi:hypothetical protein ACEQ8H_004208 [Pleosporales sp. CAS-2024a]